jgi:hypothetical protein
VISRINAGCVWLSASSSSAIVRDLKPITGGGRYVFPSLRGADRPISANTVNFALRSMGYSGDDITGHGFRAMASTCLNEQGFPPDIIELQLAHSERNEVRAAYNRAKRMLERRDMMQNIGVIYRDSSHLIYVEGQSLGLPRYLNNRQLGKVANRHFVKHIWIVE